MLWSYYALVVLCCKNLDWNPWFHRTIFGFIGPLTISLLIFVKPFGMHWDTTLGCLRSWDQAFDCFSLNCGCLVLLNRWVSPSWSHQVRCDPFLVIFNGNRPPSHIRILWGIRHSVKWESVTLFRELVTHFLVIFNGNRSPSHIRIFLEDWSPS